MRKIHFAPVGILHRLNLTALYIQDEEVMTDRYYMNQLYHPGSIIDTFSQNIDLGTALIAGGINFNFNSDSTHLNSSSMPYWKDLKWTLNEAQEIEKICNQSGMVTRLLTKDQVTERDLRNIFQQGSFSIIHIATHGFFFHQIDSSLASIPDFQKNIQQLDDPMFRSGILLAGSNYTWSTSASKAPDQDGVLTAYEPSSLPMDHTDLVVLSACETGLGDIEDAEGVYGLQRALKIAGVKYMIISLWQVPDKETSTFMVTFYQNLIYSNKEIEKAFHKTQQEMRERFVNPYQWAGFVLIE
ncbi:MAG: CHAT domain-containing protein [Saprospiraceae bacterium]|nr:CHAT domain-containing protein [Candidatus Vicinibacter affinis]